MKGNYQIPFDEHGNQLDYPGWPAGHGGVQWRDNEPFEDELSYGSFYRGRSAAGFIFTRSGGQRVTVFLKDFEEMIPHLVAGKIKGTFWFTKRGTNYGCQLKEPK